MGDYEKLGEGSIVEVDGDLFKKTGRGDLWVVLGPRGLPQKLPVRSWGTVEVLRETAWSPLAGLGVGTVIAFDNGEIAHQHRPGFWTVAGYSEEFLTEELTETMVDRDSVRVLGNA